MSRLRNRYHPIVWWAVLFHALFGLSFTLLVPMYRGPDESRHVDMVRHYASSSGYPDPSQYPTMSPSVAATLTGRRTKTRPALLAADAVPRPDRATFEELGGASDASTEGLPKNQMSQHPPVFYAATSALARVVAAIVPAGGWTWDREVYLYRLISWASLAALPLLAAEGALAIGLARRHTAVAAAFPLLVPMATFIGAVVNSDGLAVLFSCVAVVGALAYFDRGRAPWVIVAAVGCAVAPLAKSTAAPVAVWAVLVVLAGVVRARGELPWRRSVGHLAIVGAGALIGFSWYLTNLVRFGSLQPPSSARLNPVGSYDDTSMATYTWRWTTRVASTFWGQPGRRTGVTLPPLVIVALTALAVVLVVIAIAFAGRRCRWSTWMLGLLVAAQVGLMYRTTWRIHTRDGVFRALQGRYLFVLLVPLAVLVAVAVARLMRRREGMVPFIGGSLVAIGVGLHLMLGWSMFTAGYWGGDGATGRFDAVLAWSPLPVAMTIAVFAANAGAVALAALVAACSVRRSRPTTVQPASAPTTREIHVL